MEFISTLREEGGCFLCQAAQAEADEGSLVVHRGVRGFVMLNRYPYANGHLLVAPYVHTGELDALPEETLLELMTLLRESRRALAEVCCPDGFNIGLNLGKDAGAGVADHLHLHVVPRWRGDTNFMPILADTKVIPQALQELVTRLRSQWRGSSSSPGGAA
jgi:ATP adenylyltransferase